MRTVQIYTSIRNEKFSFAQNREIMLICVYVMIGLTIKTYLIYVGFLIQHAACLVFIESSSFLN